MFRLRHPADDLAMLRRQRRIRSAVARTVASGLRPTMQCLTTEYRGGWTVAKHEEK